jgi:hypothetical protein
MDDPIVYTVDSSSDSEDCEYRLENQKSFIDTNNNNNNEESIDDTRVLSTQEVFDETMNEVQNVCDVSGVSKANSITK